MGFNENQIEETKVAMVSRANQLKKAREDFFFGKESSPGGVQQSENSPIISRPSTLPIRSEKGSNLQDSPSSDKDLSGAPSTRTRQIKRFGGPTRPNGGFRHSFTENLAEGEEDADLDSSNENAQSPKQISPEKHRKMGARPKKY